MSLEREATHERLEALEAAARNTPDSVERELITEMAARYRNWCMATGQAPRPAEPTRSRSTMRCGD